MKKVGTVVVKTYMEECLDKTQRKAGGKREDALKIFRKPFLDILTGRNSLREADGCPDYLTQNEVGGLYG